MVTWFQNFLKTNHFWPKSHQRNPKHGPFDHLLGAHQCDWILELMAREDYVIDLLKDEFLVKYDREPSSLSDIVKIAAQREKISAQNQSVPKAVFETRHDTCQMGSTWIVTFHKINGVDEQQRTLPNVYVHKIVRAPEIRLERLRLPINYRRRVLCVLYEPFLIVFESEKRIDFFNLLKPNEQPKSLTGEGEFMKPEGYYQADVRRNGKILDDVIFPIVRKIDARTFCVDFALITRLSVDIILEETIKLPENDAQCLKFLDHDNFLLISCQFRDDEDTDEIRGCAAFLIIPSKKKIISYYLPDLSGYIYIPAYGMVDERFGLIVWDAAFNDDDDDQRILAYGLLSEKCSLEVICFFKLLIDQEIYMEEDLILQSNQEKGKYTTVSFKALINHLEEMGQAMPSLTRPVNGCIITRPIVEIEKLRSEGFVKDVCEVPVTRLCLTWCNIGRIICKPSDLMEIQIFV